METCSQIESCQFSKDLEVLRKLTGFFFSLLFLCFRLCLHLYVSTFFIFSYSLSHSLFVSLPFERFLSPLFLPSCDPCFSKGDRKIISRFGS